MRLQKRLLAVVNAFGGHVPALTKRPEARWSGEKGLGRKSAVPWW